MVNFGLLAAETASLVWGTQANFKGFRVFARYCTQCYSGFAILISFSFYFDFHFLVLVLVLVFNYFLVLVFHF